MDADHLFLHSYRRVFRVERRLYRIEDWRLPLPGGIPLRAIVYFFAAELAVLVLARAPGTGLALAVLPVEWRFGVLPIACAMAGWWISPDGRPAHRFAATWLRARLTRRRRRAGLAVRAEGERLATPERLAIRPGVPGSRALRARVRGPAAIALCEPLLLHSRPRGRGRREQLELRPAGGRRARGEAVEGVVLEEGQTLWVRP